MNWTEQKEPARTCCLQHSSAKGTICLVLPLQIRYQPFTANSVNPTQISGRRMDTSICSMMKRRNTKRMSLSDSRGWKPKPTKIPKGCPAAGCWSGWRSPGLPSGIEQKNANRKRGSDRKNPNCAIICGVTVKVLRRKWQWTRGNVSEWSKSFLDIKSPITYALIIEYIIYKCFYFQLWDQTAFSKKSINFI